MKLNSANPLTRPSSVTAGILLIGLGSAIAIFLTADDIPDNPFAEFEQSKRFANEVQRMGGKMALVANDASAWFAALWHGRQLAYTVAGITCLIAVGYYMIASSMKPGDDDAMPRDDDNGI